MCYLIAYKDVDLCTLFHEDYINRVVSSNNEHLLSTVIPLYISTIDSTDVKKVVIVGSTKENLPPHVKFIIPSEIEIESYSHQEYSSNFRKPGCTGSLFETKDKLFIYDYNSEEQIELPKREIYSSAVEILCRDIGKMHLYSSHGELSEGDREEMIEYIFNLISSSTQSITSIKFPYLTALLSQNMQNMQGRKYGELTLDIERREAIIRAVAKALCERIDGVMGEITLDSLAYGYLLREAVKLIGNSKIVR